MTARAPDALDAALSDAFNLPPPAPPPKPTEKQAIVDRALAVMIEGDARALGVGAPSPFHPRDGEALARAGDQLVRASGHAVDPPVAPPPKPPTTIAPLMTDAEAAAFNEETARLARESDLKRARDQSFRKRLDYVAKQVRELATEEAKKAEEKRREKKLEKDMKRFKKKFLK